MLNLSKHAAIKISISITHLFFFKPAPLEAESEGDIATVQTLLEAGVDVKAKNKDGQTALSIAANRGHTNIVRLLKKAGAKK